MRRREFLGVLGGAATWPLTAHGQQSGRVRRIGVLLLARDESVIRPFVQQLEALGHIIGQTVAIDYRFADGKPERVPEMATELVKLNPDVIFSFGGEQAPVLKRTTDKIPVVVAVSNDPVRGGLVPSLARPSGNITGMTYINDQLAGKTLEYCKEAVPSISRVAVMWNPDHADPEYAELTRAAQLLKVQLQSLVVRQPDDFDAAFETATRERPEAIIVIWSRITTLHRQKVGTFAGTNRIILISALRYWNEVGALLTYGPNLPDGIRLCATYVDRILKGTRAADLPIQQPTKFELVINLKTAKALGITVPAMLLARADEVIE
jgi:putative ABC transport system substrate-binding protein